MRTKFHRLFSALALLALSTLNPQLSTWAQGAPGDLDTTFAGTGESRIGFGGGYGAGTAAAVQSDGKLVLAGYGQTASNAEFVLVRFGTNNAPDLTFGGEGKVVTPVGSANIAEAAAVGIQSDGKIVAAGYAYN